MAKVELETLFSRMSREEPPPESARSQQQRRVRIVAQMRTRHVELVHERVRWRNQRRRFATLLVAASLAAATAIAGAAGIGPLSALRVSFQGTFARSSAAAPRAAARVGARVVAPAPAKVTAEAVESSLAVAPPVPAERAAPPPASKREEDRQLEAVNRLFADARRARRDGRDAEALVLLDQLVARYPHSVLAQEAAVERFRALARLGRGAEASRAARSYLARYPGGFGSEEAARLLENPDAR
jgi:hypothetical protein